MSECFGVARWRSVIAKAIEVQLPSGITWYHPGPSNGSSAMSSSAQMVRSYTTTSQAGIVNHQPHEPVVVYCCIDLIVMLAIPWFTLTLTSTAGWIIIITICGWPICTSQVYESRDAAASPVTSAPFRSCGVVVAPWLAGCFPWLR